MIEICNKERAIKVKELMEVTYDQLSNDFFGTPGQTDHKVFCSQAQNIVLLGSLFEYDKTLVRDVHENLKEGLDYWKTERSEEQE